MHQVRLAVRENTLSDPNRITESDYLAALDELGRTWVVEAAGEIAAFASGYKTGDRVAKSRAGTSGLSWAGPNNSFEPKPLRLG